VVTIGQNRWSRSVKFTGHDLLEWVVTVDQNTHQTFYIFTLFRFLIDELIKTLELVRTSVNNGELDSQIEAKVFASCVDVGCSQ
jgi:hypothetical protein